MWAYHHHQNSNLTFSPIEIFLEIILEMTSILRLPFVAIILTITMHTVVNGNTDGIPRLARPEMPDIEK